MFWCRFKRILQTKTFIRKAGNLKKLIHNESVFFVTNDVTLYCFMENRYYVISCLTINQHVYFIPIQSTVKLSICEFYWICCAFLRWTYLYKLHLHLLICWIYFLFYNKIVLWLSTITSAKKPIYYRFIWIFKFFNVPHSICCCSCCYYYYHCLC